MFSVFDFFIIVVYFSVLIIIGIISIKKIRNETDFLVAGRRLGYGLYVPAMSAVVLGGASTLGGSSLGYLYGISGMWLVVMIGLGILGMGLLFSKKLSEVKIFSVSELLNKRFGSSSRYLSAVIMSVYDIMVAVTSIIAMGVIFSTLFGWNSTVSIILGGLIVLMYTVIGGMWAVTLTDVIQFWVMTVGLIFILLPMGIVNVGGFSELTSQVDPSFLNLTGIGGSAIFSYFLLYFFGMMIGQDIWQRAFTAKNSRVLRKGTIYSGIYCIIYAIVGAFIGMCASVLIPGLDDPQQALPQLAINTLPVGLIGLVIAAVASAVMSTASGTIMASSTIIVNDLLQIVNSSAVSNEKTKIKLTRYVTLIVGAVAIVISAWLQDIVVALDVAYALLSGSLFIPVIAAFFWKKITAKVALYSMVISSIVVITDLAIEGITSLNAIIYGVIASGLTMLIGTFYTWSEQAKNDSTAV